MILVLQLLPLLLWRAQANPGGKLSLGTSGWTRKRLGRGRGRLGAWVVYEKILDGGRAERREAEETGMRVSSVERRLTLRTCPNHCPPTPRLP